MMLQFLSLVAMFLLTHRLGYLRGYRAASRKAADIARMATVEAARADVPPCHPAEPERSQAKLAEPYTTCDCAVPDPCARNGMCGGN